MLEDNGQPTKRRLQRPRRRRSASTPRTNLKLIPHAADPRADVNGDDFVGQADLDTVLTDWGLGTPPVPEPATLSLLALSGSALLRPRCR